MLASAPVKCMMAEYAARVWSLYCARASARQRCSVSGHAGHAARRRASTAADAARSAPNTHLAVEVCAAGQSSVSTQPTETGCLPGSGQGAPTLGASTVEGKNDAANWCTAGPGSP